jgi:hypothetical protein
MADIDRGRVGWIADFNDLSTERRDLWTAAAMTLSGRCKSHSVGMHQHPSARL